MYSWLFSSVTLKYQTPTGILFNASQILKSARIHFRLALPYSNAIHIVSTEAENTVFQECISSALRFDV